MCGFSSDEFFSRRTQPSCRVGNLLIVFRNRLSKKKLLASQRRIRNSLRRRRRAAWGLALAPYLGRSQVVAVAVWLRPRTRAPTACSRSRSLSSASVQPAFFSLGRKGKVLERPANLGLSGNYKCLGADALGDRISPCDPSFPSPHNYV